MCAVVLTRWTQRVLPSAGSSPAHLCLSPGHHALCSSTRPRGRPGLAQAAAPDWTAKEGCESMSASVFVQVIHFIRLSALNHQKMALTTLKLRVSDQQ